MAKQLKSARRMAADKRSKRPLDSENDAAAAASDSPARAARVTAQILGAQRKLWNAGVSALARGRKAAVPMPTAAIAESLQGGLKKLEEVFDQRVLGSLAHAGMPSPKEMCELMERVEALSAEVKRLSRKRGRK
jgi:Poly(hydroxyalcanoate) granule associated protein (phasin)